MSDRRCRVCKNIKDMSEFIGHRKKAYVQACYSCRRNQVESRNNERMLNKKSDAFTGNGYVEFLENRTKDKGMYDHYPDSSGSLRVHI